MILRSCIPLPQCSLGAITLCQIEYESDASLPLARQRASNQHRNAAPSFRKSPSRMTEQSQSSSARHARVHHALAIRPGVRSVQRMRPVARSHGHIPPCEETRHWPREIRPPHPDENPMILASTRLPDLLFALPTSRYKWAFSNADPACEASNLRAEIGRARRRERQVVFEVEPRR